MNGWWTEKFIPYPILQWRSFVLKKYASLLPGNEIPPNKLWLVLDTKNKRERERVVANLKPIELESSINNLDSIYI